MTSSALFTTAENTLFQIDLRSDTVTKPSRAMRDAMAAAIVGDDVLDGDPTALHLEEQVAQLVGKERALFFPTGSMANMAAVLTQTTPGTEVLVDADAHLLQGEMAGAAVLGGVQLRTMQGNPIFDETHLIAALREPEKDSPDLSLVCVENTHNGAGGMITPLATLQRIAAVAREHGLPVHMDGARLWNASAASGTSLAEFAACADTVMLSFSKGLGAPVGAILVGSDDVITRAWRIRKRLGGGMRQSGIIAAGALYGLQHNLARLDEDHRAARELAARVDGKGGARVVPPDTNIVMIDLPHARADQVAKRAQALGVRISRWTPTRVRCVTHLDAPFEKVQEAGDRLAAVLQEVLY